MNIFKETWILIKLLFTSLKNCNKLEVMKMEHYPFSGYIAMSWCGKLIQREQAPAPDEETMTHETIHLLQAKTHFSRWILYYIDYIWNYLSGAIYMFSLDAGYYTGKYESEAYAKEQDPNYLEGYSKNNIKTYTFSLSTRKRLWKQVGQDRKAWKEFVKGL